MWSRAAAVVCIATLWCGFAPVAMYRYAGVMLTDAELRPLSVFQEMVVRGLPMMVLGAVLSTIALVAYIGVRGRRAALFPVAASIVVVGTPLCVLGGGMFLSWLWQSFDTNVVWFEHMPVVVGLVIGMLVGFVIGPIWNGRSRRNKEPHIACSRCGYDLRGVTGDGEVRCPECGACLASPGSLDSSRRDPAGQVQNVGSSPDV